MLIVAAGALGAILGSFLNALLYRYNTGLSVMRGRSTCTRCGHTLAAVDLVPILSFIVLRGRCRYCHTRISWQYPVVESAALVLAVATYYLYPEPGSFAFWLAVHLVLLFVLVYDLRHKIIPTEALLLLLAAACGHLLYIQSPLHDYLAGILLALPLFLFSLVSKGRWMGWGDAPLQLALGMLLGLSMGLTALFLSFWMGAVVGIGLILLAKGYRMKSELPFAPFLIAGFWVAHFFHVDFFPLLPFLFL